MKRLLTALLLLIATPARAGDVIAVMYFENTGNAELEMLKLGLAQMLITDLASAGADVVERSRINEVLAELELQRSQAVDPGSAVKMGRLLGADKLVLGSYFELFGRLQIYASIVDVETGRIETRKGIGGQVADFVGLERGLAEQLVAALPRDGGTLRGGGADGEGGEADEAIAMADGRSERGRRRGEGKEKPARKAASDPAASSASGGQAAQAATGSATATGGVDADAETKPAEPVRSTPTVTPLTAPAERKDPLGAALAFSEGLDLLDRKDVLRARDSFRRALDLDPTLDPARVELAALKIGP